MDVPAIELVALTKRFRNARKPAVNSVNLSVSQGEVLAIVGGSGSGKTTTLKMINRLIEPTSGAVRVMGEEVTNRDPVILRRSIGYAFQGVGLFPHMTVGQNVGVTLRLLGQGKEYVSERVDELLAMVELPADEYRDRLPAELSGGQQQRVGFARALASQPRAILMDEPFGALDPITRDGLQQEFRSLQKKLQLSVVLVTHDMSEAILLSDRVAVMHEGEVAQVGSPQELLTNPVNDYVAQLIDTPRRHSDFIESLMRSAPSEGTQ
ncbi:ATP-binding cassette domain-containing protein [Pirellulales bacterium]|nr:ATP-binding cassette domain-containing protein [Pirellulales bacterium]MDA7938883.1 ATP-binding cassette domain-containing protein [Pirellulales bacterium]